MQELTGFPSKKDAHELSSNEKTKKRERFPHQAYMYPSSSVYVGFLI